MYQYRAFGGHLQSAFELPDFAESGAPAADWTVRLNRSVCPREAIELGAVDTAAGGALRLYATDDGVRFESDLVGTWDISRRGAVVCVPPRDISPEILRSMLLGPVFSQLLEWAGALCLHGSAVALADRGLAFIAPKLHGKSTLALALTVAGGQLITDDLVAVEEPSLTVRPGTRGIRLFGDAIERLGVQPWASSTAKSFKCTLTALPSHLVCDRSCPLSAIYVLAPCERSHVVERVRLFGAEAAIAIAQRMKLPDSLLGAAAARERLGRIARLICKVDVYRLTFSRGWDNIPHTVQQLLAWHTVSSVTARQHDARDQVVTQPPQRLQTFA